jgi:glycosyltransferase involved in cell wall biosynthesis
MNISIYGGSLLRYHAKALEKDGHQIFFNKFSSDAEVVICQSHSYIYEVYKILKRLRKNKVKLINLILDIPPWRLEKNFIQNSLFKNIRQNLFHFSHKHTLVNNRILPQIFRIEKGGILKRSNLLLDKIFNKPFRNKVFYQVNYRNFLKKSDLKLSISKFTQILLKKFLKLNSEVNYLGINSDIILNLPKSSGLKYDAINISRIMKTKRQELFAKAAKILGINVAVIGKHQDKSIKLSCPHYYLEDYTQVMKLLRDSRFYVDPSQFEGFGITPVEAAFLNKTTIASNTYIHREILGDYPLYFKINDLDDLVEKMRIVHNNEFTSNKSAIEKIKKKFSVQAAKDRLIAHIESII